MVLFPADFALDPQDVSATVFHHLGIDAGKILFHNQFGLPIPLVKTGKPIRELVG